MIANSLKDGALVIAALAVLVVAFAGLLLVHRRGLGRVTVRAGSLEASLEAVKSRVDHITTGVDQINNAVNHVAPGSPTLVQRVTDTEAKVDYLVDAVTAISHHVGCKIPPHRGD